MDETVLLGHGSGGSMMKRIIDEVFFEAYAGEELRVGDDAARLEAPEGERFRPTASWSPRSSFRAAISGAWPCAVR